MSPSLKAEIRQKLPFSSLEEEAFLNLQRSANLLMQVFSRTLKPLELTPTQYNALRILRGAHPGDLNCGEVGNRLVTPVPDVTRLLDRLESRGFVQRSRDDVDRRVVLARITDTGLELLAKLDLPVAESLEILLGHLGKERLQTLITFLESAREPSV